MKQTVIYEMSELLDSFNLEEISKLLNSQLQITETDMTIQSVDHFKPLYYKYLSIVNTEENSSDIKEEAKTRFMDICNIFLSMICKKFDLGIDETWKDEHYEDLPGFTMALYSFFVLDLTNNIHEVCINYIKNNKNYIYEAFEERKNKKDASTLVSKKIMTPEMAVIAANIYDVTTWILSQLSEEQFIMNMNQDYCPLKLISQLLEDGIMSGDFMTEINDLYASDISIKSDVCLKIINILKTLDPK